MSKLDALIYCHPTNSVKVLRDDSAVYLHLSTLTKCSVKPKFHYADFHYVTLVTGKSLTWIRGRLIGKSQVSFWVSNHRDMSRWIEKFPWQVGNKPVCVGEMGKSAMSARRHGEVVDVADKSMGTSRFVTDLSRTSWRSQHSGIWT